MKIIHVFESKQEMLDKFDGKIYAIDFEGKHLCDLLAYDFHRFSSIDKVIDLTLQRHQDSIYDYECSPNRISDYLLVDVRFKKEILEKSFNPLFLN